MYMEKLRSRFFNNLMCESERVWVNRAKKKAELQTSLSLCFSLCFLYPGSDSNRHVREDTGVWDQRVYHSTTRAEKIIKKNYFTLKKLCLRVYLPIAIGNTTWAKEFSLKLNV